MESARRLQWQLRTSINGGYFMAADNCPYFVSLYNKIGYGVRATIMDQEWLQIGSETTVTNAKRRIKQLLKRRDYYGCRQINRNSSRRNFRTIRAIQS